MALGPRVVFARFESVDSPKLVPWTLHVERVLATAPAPAAGDDGVIVWQLVSANNRQLARSARVHPSFDSASQDAQRVIDEVDRLEFVPVSERGRGVYGWYANVGDDSVVVCAKWYVTDRDRRHSMALAHVAMGTARLREGTRLIDPKLLRLMP